MPTPYAPGAGQFESEAGAFAREELVRNLNEDAGAVASFGIASAGAAVGEVDQYLDSLADDVVALLAANVGDKSNATGIVLVRRIVQTLRWRQAIRAFCFWRSHCNLAQIPRRMGQAVGRAHNNQVGISRNYSNYSPRRLKVQCRISMRRMRKIGA